MTESKKQRMIREPDTRVCYLRLTGLDDTALFIAMADRIVDFKSPMDAAEPSGMDSLAGRLPDLGHYAQLPTGVAASIQDGTIKVPR